MSPWVISDYEYKLKSCGQFIVALRHVNSDTVSIAVVGSASEKLTL